MFSMSGCERKVDLSRFNQEVIKEILKHKWIESEKARHDIGSRKAAEDWIEKYYDSWLQWKLSQDK